MMLFLLGIVILALCGYTAALTVYVLRRSEAENASLRRERDAYQQTLFGVSKLSFKAFAPEAEANDAPVEPVEMSDADWRSTWTELDRQAYDAFCRGVAADEHITHPEDQWEYYKRLYGRRMPYEVGRI